MSEGVCDTCACEAKRNRTSFDSPLRSGMILLEGGK